MLISHYLCLLSCGSIVFLEDVSESIGEKVRQRNVFLANESPAPDVSVRQKVQYGARARSGAKLNRGVVASGKFPAIDPVCVGDLFQPPVTATGYLDENDHHILIRHWQRVREHVQQQFPTVGKAQVA